MSKRYPRAFPWLAQKLKEQAELGNLLVDVMVMACKAAALAKQQLGKVVLLFSEHPEDLGRVRREEDGLEMDPDQSGNGEKSGSPKVPPAAVVHCSVFTMLFRYPLSETDQGVD